MWFFYALLAPLFFGLFAVLLKIPAHRGVSKRILLFWSTFTSTIVSIILVIVVGPEISVAALGLGFLWALFWVMTTHSQMRALGHVPTQIVFPVTTSSTILVIIVGVLLFNESLTFFQVGSIAIMLGGIFLLIIENNKNAGALAFSEKFKRGIIFALFAMIFSTLAKITQTFGSTIFHPIAFLFATQLGAGIINSALVFPRKERLGFFDKAALGFGVLNGLALVLGILFLLLALSQGPSSIVFSIHPSYLLVATFLGAIAFKEHLGARKLFFLFVVILGLILLRITSF